MGMSGLFQCDALKYKHMHTQILHDIYTVWIPYQTTWAICIKTENDTLKALAKFIMRWKCRGDIFHNFFFFFHR